MVEKSDRLTEHELAELKEIGRSLAALHARVVQARGGSMSAAALGLALVLAALKAVLRSYELPEVYFDG